MMQRNVTIGKSPLKRFCLTNNKWSKTSSSSSSSLSSSSYTSATYVTPNTKSDEEIYNEQNINDFTSYLTTTNNALSTAKYISMRDKINAASMKEYDLDTNTIDKVGTAMVTQWDLSVIEIEFNLKKWLWKEIENFKVWLAHMNGKYLSL